MRLWNQREYKLSDNYKIWLLSIRCIGRCFLAGRILFHSESCTTIKRKESMNLGSTLWILLPMKPQILWECIGIAGTSSSTRRIQTFTTSSWLQTRNFWPPLFSRHSRWVTILSASTHRMRCRQRHWFWICWVGIQKLLVILNAAH